MSEIEIMRAHELAHASPTIFQVIVAVTLVFIIAVLADWAARRYHARNRRKALDRLIQRRNDASPHCDEVAWREFADRNDLPKSTRITLFATVRKN